ncbi:MAG: glycosyltransferase [Thermoplasmata archaeon]|nr:glycosyltransferase [Thermoplasmata archaeon]
MTPPLLQRVDRPHQGRRLLLVSPYPPSRTGPAEYAAVFSAQCAARGFDVRVLSEVVSGAPPLAAPAPGVEIDPVWTPSLSGLRQLYRAAYSDSADVIHINYSFTMYGGGVAGMVALAQIARLARSRPVVVTLFDVLPKRDLTAETLRLYHIRTPPRLARIMVQSILRFLARTADRIVVQSRAIQSILVDDYGLPSGKVVVTELPGYPAAARSSAVARPTPGEAPRPTILYYGFLAPYKGVELLLEAFARARATSPDRAMRLVVAGTNHPRLDFDYAATLRSEATRLGLGPDDVQFPGYVDETTSQALFHTSSLVVLPYLRATGVSGTLASAMGHNRAVLVSDLPPLVGQLNGYPHSRVIAPGDAHAMTETLRTVAEGRFVPRPPRSTAPGSVRHWAELVDRTAEVYASAIAARRTQFVSFSGEFAGETEAQT